MDVCREYKGNSLDCFERDYVVLDLETTGFSPIANEIIEIGAVKVVDGDVTETFHRFVKCQDGVPDVIERLTGISDSLLEAEGVSLSKAVVDFDEFVSDAVIVGHNINFDINFMYDAYVKVLFKPFTNDYIDTMRIAKSLVKDTFNHKMGTLARKFEIANDQPHRALNDCLVTKALYEKLEYINQNFIEIRMAEIEKTFHEDPIFANTKVSIKTKLKYIEGPIIREILNRMNSKVYFALLRYAKVLVVNDNAYRKLQEPLDYSDEYFMFFNSWMVTAQQRRDAGDLIIVSETEFCDKLGIPKGNEIIRDRDENNPLYGKTCVFTGTLDRMNRKQAEKIVECIGGVVGGGVTKKTNYLILGNNDYNAAVKNGKSSKHKKAEEYQSQGIEIEIIPEDLFYELIGED